MKIMKQVFSYGNYRDFLRDHYLARKGEGGFTYERFSRLADLKSPNLLKLVIDGKKNLTPGTALAFAKALGLLGEEKDYFFFLVQENQARQAQEKKYFQTHLKKLKPGRETRVQRSTGKSGLYENIFLTMAACALQGMKTGEEAKILVEDLGMPASLAKETFSALTKTDLLHATEGVWRIDARHVIFQEKIPSPVLKKFLRDQILFSLSACDTEWKDDTKFLSHVMTVDPDDVKEIQEKLDAHLTGLNTLYEKSRGVPLQVNCQSFRVRPDVMREFLKRKEGAASRR